MTSSNAAETSILTRLCDFCIRHRWWVLAGNLLLCAVAMFLLATRLQVSTDLASAFSSGSEEKKITDHIRGNFGDDLYFQVIVRGNVFSEPYIEKLKILHGAIENIQLENFTPLPPQGFENKQTTLAEDDFDFESDDSGWGDEGGGVAIDEVLSLVNARDFSMVEGGEDRLDTKGLLEKKWPDLGRLRERVMKDPDLGGFLIGNRGQSSVLVVRTVFMSDTDQLRVYQELTKLEKKYTSAEFDIHVGGFPAVSASLVLAIQKDIPTLLTLAFLVMGFFMFWLFRHPLGIIAPLVVVGTAQLWTLAAMAICNVPVTVVTTVLPAFIVVIGIADAVHMQSVYRLQRDGGKDRRQALLYAAHHTGIPIFLTSATTAVGLISFNFADLTAIHDLGTFGAVGVVFAFLQSVTTLPVLLTFHKKGSFGIRRKAGRDRVDAFLAWCNRLSLGKGRSIVVSSVVVALFVLSFLGFRHIRVEHNPISWFPKEAPLRQAMDHLKRDVGPSSNLVLVLNSGSDRSLTDLDLLKKLETLEKEIWKFRHPHDEAQVVFNIASILDPVRDGHRFLSGGPYALPTTQGGVDDVLSRMFELYAGSELRRLITIDRKDAIMVVRTSWLDTGSYYGLVDHTNAAVNKIFGDEINITFGGSAFSLIGVVRRLLTDMVNSFAIALLVITLMMFFMLRSFKFAVISLVPNILPIALILAFMGFSEYPLDLSDVTLASVALGIVVDDTIHFLHKVRLKYGEVGNMDDAVSYAYEETGRAIIGTSIILASGFGVYVFSSMIHLQRFGILLAATMVLALLIDLIATPALLRLAGRFS